LTRADVADVFFKVLDGAAEFVCMLLDEWIHRFVSDQTINAFVK
jgi:hypothetical protein